MDQRTRLPSRCSLRIRVRVRVGGRVRVRVRLRVRVGAGVVRTSGLLLRAHMRPLAGLDLTVCEPLRLSSHVISHAMEATVNAIVCTSHVINTT